MRFQASGDVAVGPYYTEGTTDHVSYVSEGSLLLFGVPERAPVSFVGVHPPSRECTDFVPPLGIRVPFADACSASAPLRDVTCIEIFRDEEREKYCRGFIFHYRDGRKRALGSCRFGIDPVEQVAAPFVFCFLTIGYDFDDTLFYSLARVTPGEEAEITHEGWTFCSSEDILEVSFTENLMIMETKPLDAEACIPCQ